ncbi:ROK family protein [Pedobacter sp. ASV28]|uniref:ROK family protein n=1 Tax=Pedobacter sp. ASV28 TaxID=2795123 RepID=UPI0018EAE3E7|nr:ROK family protein [Pedobacter sp. ASV28]
MSVKNQFSKGNILTIDIGGTNVKACILNSNGKIVTDYVSKPTPKNARPSDIIDTIKDLCQDLRLFEKISVGFPGYVRNGVVQTAPNLAENQWTNIDLADRISHIFGKPVRLINDADLQGLGIVKGKGLEIVFTLGTGFGTALLFDGDLLPHFELAHLPINKADDYDDFIGKKGLEKVGKAEWNKRLKYVIEIYKTVFNYDTLYIGGGNSANIDFKLDHNIRIVSNQDGIKGGAKLWKAKEKFLVCTNFPKTKA